jgi:aspartate racemase
MIASNTMHKLVDDVRSATDLPLTHIADATVIPPINKNTYK